MPDRAQSGQGEAVALQTTRKTSKRATSSLRGPDASSDPALLHADISSALSLTSRAGDPAFPLSPGLSQVFAFHPTARAALCDPEMNRGPANRPPYDRAAARATLRPSRLRLPPPCRCRLTPSPACSRTCGSRWQRFQTWRVRRCLRPCICRCGAPPARGPGFPS